MERRAKLSLAHTAPVENVPAVYLASILRDNLTLYQLVRKLRIGQFICDRAIRTIMLETDVRSATNILAGIEKIEATKAQMAELYNALHI